MLWDFLIYLSSSSSPDSAGLGPPDLDSGPDLFDLLILNLLILDLLILNLLFQYLLAFDLLLLPLYSLAFLLEPTLLNAQALQSNVTSDQSRFE